MHASLYLPNNVVKPRMDTEKAGTRFRAFSRLADDGAEFQI